MVRKRRRSLRARSGELIAFYGYADGDGPDLCTAWGGDGAQKPDSRLLMNAFSANVPGSGSDLPFYKELERRGYDLSTMKFTIRCKAPQPNDPGQPSSAKHP